MTLEKTPQESVTVLAQVMMPADANSIGIVHGGNLLHLIDQAAGVCAVRHAGTACVTASINHVYFIKPVHVGEVVTLKACVNYVGKTSMEIGVRVEAEDVKTGKKRHTNSCYLTFVAVDDNDRPTEAPRLRCVTDDEKRRYREAEQRRKESKKQLETFRNEMTKD